MADLKKQTRKLSDRAIETTFGTVTLMPEIYSKFSQIEPSDRIVKISLGLINLLNLISPLSDN